MQSFNVGPFVFSLKLALLALAVMLTFFVGNRIARKSGTDVERALWSILFVGAGSARLAFVITYRATYANAPWTILDIRDGGFNAAVGLAGASVMAVIFAVRKQHWRKPLLVSLLSGALLWAGGTAMFAPGSKPVSVPQISLSDLEGQEIRIGSFVGKPMVVNLWATWCPPCRREMPVFRDAQQANKDIVFVFANQGESVDAVRKYLGSEGLVLEHVLLDPAGELAKHVGSVAMPTTLFFNADGKLVDTRVGAVSTATLAHRIDALRASR